VSSGTTQITVTVGTSATPGVYNLSVRGLFSPLQHAAALTLTIQ
jgi:hypothetical protein